MDVWGASWADVWNDVWADFVVSNQSPLIAGIRAYPLLGGAGSIRAAIVAAPSVYPALTGDPNANEFTP